MVTVVTMGVVTLVVIVMMAVLEMCFQSVYVQVKERV